MYVEIHQDYKCSSCGDVNCIEKVWRESKQIIRCISCNHEKVIAEVHTTTTCNTDTESLTYMDATIYPDLIEF